MLDKNFFKFMGWGVKAKIVRTYYQITASLPRNLPTTDQEFEKMRKVLIENYGLTNDPAIWATICGHIGGTPKVELKRSYGYLAKAGKRVGVNALAYKQGQLAVNELQDKLKEKVLKIVEDDGNLSKGTPDL